MQSIQNLGLAVTAILAGLILDSKGYLYLELFFISCVSGKALGMVSVSHLSSGVCSDQPF